MQLAQAKGPEDAPRSQQEVDKWFEDYMGLLYRHIEFKLGAELPSTKSWETAKIEFLCRSSPSSTVNLERSFFGFVGRKFHNDLLEYENYESAFWSPQVITAEQNMLAFY